MSKKILTVHSPTNALLSLAMALGCLPETSAMLREDETMRVHTSNNKAKENRRRLSKKGKP